MNESGPAKVLPRLTGSAKIAGVMGYPVAHSRSPRLHGYWLAQHDIDGAYVPFPVKPEDLAPALRALPKLGIRGCNLTIPHKERALEIVDEVDSSAALVGAVNTVIVRDGRLCGSNTDIEGFRDNVRDNAPGFSGSQATVIGAGGAARAVIAALSELGVRHVRLVNRTPERAAAVARALRPLPLSIEPVSWQTRDAALRDADILVNATSLGLSGGSGLSLSLDALPARALVCDVVYVPLETPLLAAARRRGHPVVDGLGMLLYQARRGFAAWFGVLPEVTPALRAYMQDGL